MFLASRSSAHHSLLTTKMSPWNSLVSTLRAWRPSVTYPDPRLSRNPIFSGCEGLDMSTMLTPPVGQSAPQSPTYAYQRPSPASSAETSEMSPSKCVRRTLPTTSTFSEDPGRWPVVGPCWSRWLLPPPSSGPTLRPCEIWRSSGPALDSFVKKLAVSFARLWCAVAELASPANAIRNSTTRATELRRISHLPLEDCSAWHPGGRPG